MKELIQRLEKKEKVDYLLDTCFLLYEFSKGRVKELKEFCSAKEVGMTSFNLQELEHVVKKLPGPISRHVRDFLKERLVYDVEVDVMPGDREGEKRYVQEYDKKILGIVKDPSDAVMFVAALKMGADVLTRDRHHVFTCAAENYTKKIRVENKIE